MLETKALILLALGSYDEAISCLMKASNNYEHLVAWNLAYAYYRKGDIKNARRVKPAFDEVEAEFKNDVVEVLPATKKPEYRIYFKDVYGKLEFGFHAVSLSPRWGAYTFYKKLVGSSDG